MTEDKDNGFVDLSDWLGQGPDQPEGGAVPEGTAEAEPEPEVAPKPEPRSGARPTGPTPHLGDSLWGEFREKPASASRPDGSPAAGEPEGRRNTGVARRLRYVLLGELTVLVVVFVFLVAVPSVSVYGYVTDAETGAPVEGATVTVAPQLAPGDVGEVADTTGADGSWSVMVGVARMRVTASAPGYATRDDTVDLWGEDGSVNRSFQLYRIVYTVRGTVYMDSDDSPVEGAQVFVYDSNHAFVGGVVTAADGTYQLELPSAGDYLLIAKAIHTGYSTRHLSVCDESPTDEVECYPPQSDFNGNAGYVCVVSDASTGEAIEGATVTYAGDDDPGTTSDDGEQVSSWSLSGSTQDLTLEISADGYTPQEVPVQLVAGTVSHVEVALQPAG